MAKQPEKNQDKIDVLYQWLSYELQQAKDTLLTELKMSSAQIGSLYGELKSEHEQSSKAVSQEIRYSYKQNQTIYDGLSAMLTKEVGERLNSVDEKLNAVADIQNILNEIDELKRYYSELLADTRAIGDAVTNDVSPKLDEIASKQAGLEQLEATLNELLAKLDEIALSEEDVQKISDNVSEKTEASVKAYSEEIIESVKAIENVDYTRITEDVGDKLVEILNDLKSAEAPVEAEVIDYDRIIYGAAEKVVESIPAPEKVDYERVENAIAAIEKVDYERIENAMPTVDAEAIAEIVASKVVVPEVDYERIADLAASKIVIPEAPAAPELDYERLADLVAARIAVPAAPAAPEIDYERLADLVIERMTSGTEQTCEVMLDDAGIEEIAAKVADKIVIPDTIDYDKVCQAAQAAQILPDPVDYDRIAEIVEDKLASEDGTYDLVMDEEGLSAIAKGVSEEICQMCANCALAEEEEVVEEATEEVVEEAPVEEIVEEAVEEPVEEVIEEAPVEVESAADAPVEEELAPTLVFDETGNELVDAETGLVIRLKRSFTAKMKQSEEKIKGYYSDIKNELTSYKKVNSNVSWHGDRFNYGRDTIAKININGKTLCFYIALDPNDPELKTTVYHQKDVGGQKAYENTPFMVKVKSDVAVKKALRLVGILADKLGTEKEEGFEAVDYVEEFGYESTKQLFEGGYIKATKEKKVNFNF